MQSVILGGPVVWIVASLSAIVVVGAVLVVLHAVWTQRRSGRFRCKIRVSEGWLTGYGTSWPRRASRAEWARDVLLVYRGMGLVRLEALPVARAEGKVRSLPGRDVSGLGDDPAALCLVLDDGPRLEVAAPAAARALLCGPYLVAQVQAERGSQDSR